MRRSGAEKENSLEYLGILTLNTKKVLGKIFLLRKCLFKFSGGWGRWSHLIWLILISTCPTLIIFIKSSYYLGGYLYTGKKVGNIKHWVSLLKLEPAILTSSIGFIPMYWGGQTYYHRVVSNWLLADIREFLDILVVRLISMSGNAAGTITRKQWH